MRSRRVGTRRARAGAAVFVVLMSSSWSVHAQTLPAADGGVAPDAGAPVKLGLSAPKLLEAAPPVFPATADPAGAIPEVTVRVTVDTDGHVSEAEVIVSGGEAFDAAARDAALQFRFSPATRDGVPLVARIPVSVSFKPPAPAPSPVIAPPPPPPPAAQPALPPPAPLEVRPQEVTVQGQQREIERLQESAEAVTVKDMKNAKRETSTLGEVLARLPGISIRRSGGLGSNERISLNGLSDDRIATFIDGIPLDYSFFPFGLSSFPVSLSDCIEVYKGVVPLRFGADALGGGINIVTDHSYENNAMASFEVGSFGTQRLAASGGYRHDPTGFVATAMGFFDNANNDFDVDVQIPDSVGRLSSATVPRFHDKYRAYGGTAEVGVVDRPWARKLLLRGFATTLDKDIQHNVIMSVPYGEARYSRSAVGANARYEVDPTRDFKLDALASYSYQTNIFIDKSEWVYNWYGQRVRPRRIAGEIESEPTDQVLWWHNFLGRVNAAYTIAPAHKVTLSSTPTYTTLTGDERIQADPSARDPLSALRDRVTVVSGVEYQANFFHMPEEARGKDALVAEDPKEGAAASREDSDYRLQNIFFVKQYSYNVWSEEQLVGNIYRKSHKSSNTFGIGDGVRFRFTPWAMVKASYEYATRLPRPEEVFGDGILVHQNLDLEPEVSHNGNFGPQFDFKRTPIGAFHVEVTGFLRDADRQIILLGNDRYFTWQNVYAARSVGVESQLNWVSPHKLLALDGSVTFQDFRNTSSGGTFGDFKGDRIPNKPWMFGSWTARFHVDRVLARDELEPYYVGRFVGDYFRSWESQGLRQYKDRVESQLTHNVGVTYVLHSTVGTMSATVEVLNLTNARVFDFFGVQRPGRGLAMKLTANWD